MIQQTLQEKEDTFQEMKFLHGWTRVQYLNGTSPREDLMQLSFTLATG